MYRILIVDDEKIERTGIKTLIEKFNYPFEASEAKNGKEAMQILDNTSIDFLITDIRMPIMDGISLIDWIREQGYAIHIVIYSAYGEFEYAQKAIRLAVDNYILKPLNIKQFRECIDSVLTNLEQEQNKKQLVEQLITENQSFLQQKVLRELINSSQEKSYSPEAHMFFDEKLAGQSITLMLLEAREPIFELYENEIVKLCADGFQNSFFALNISKYEELFFVLNTVAPSEQGLKEQGDLLLEKMSGINQGEFFVLLGKPLQKMEDIAVVYSRLERLEEYRFYLKSSTVLIDKAQSISGSRIDDAIEGILNCIFEDIKYKEYKKAIEDIQILSNTLEIENKTSNIFIRHIFSEIIRKTAAVSKYFGDEEIPEMIKYILEAKNLYDIKEYVIEKLVLLEEHKEHETKGEGGSDKLICEVIKIIRKEYPNPDISLEYLASKVYLSPNYLSTIFKNSKGETLNSFLVSYRIERAKELILTTNIKIGSIAEMVGFSSSGYFITVFRNTVGVAPAKFRELKG